jgi:hypothetical protein
VRGDKSLLAGYLYALLFWPDSPRRAKVVRCPRSGKVVASVPGLPDDFVGPKEQEIIALCLQEKAHGRRVLLLCQQTDTGCPNGHTTSSRSGNRCWKRPD